MDQLPIIKSSSRFLSSDITLPGFGYNDLDPQERTTFHAMAKCAEAARVMTYRGPDWLIKKNEEKSASTIFKDPNYLFFVKSCYYDIYPAFFDYKHLYKPIKCISSIVNQGETSFQHMNEVASLPTKQVLFRCVIRIVKVSKDTRRPASLSAEKLFQGTIHEGRTCVVPKMDKLVVPEGSFRVHLVATWNDCDNYKHVNHGSFLKFCQGAAEQLKWSEDISCYDSSHVRAVNSTHHAEASPGHELTVSVWNKGQQICFDIFNDTSQKTAYQATFDLASPELTSMATAAHL
ncbi:hypothetical protein CAPTEDRAFT_197055 [Capitella teleta]|uniref:Uncharacterized protein n=1 Tax=Capitella teleta TaxID=283909 RepID=R7VCM7_CAPTE|nr:hypothetical protein CAPTEDRAFT_197055 [Capitella teleta]|eukprot:ELU14061.1 hypothetical protein CAPTEDRAFT_197055 [Capitella teleta]